MCSAFYSTTKSTHIITNLAFRMRKRNIRYYTRTQRVGGGGKFLFTTFFKTILHYSYTYTRQTLY